MFDELDVESRGISRRELLKRAGAVSVAASLPGLLRPPAGLAALVAATPTRGGTLHAVFNGWAANTSFDPQAPAGSATDIAWRFAMFERLVQPAPFGGNQFVLAQSIEANKTATQWTIKLRKGIEWQDGSPFTADDVVYSLQRMLTKSLGLEAYSVLQMVDSKGIKKLDQYTVGVPLTYPYSDFLSQIGQRMVLIVKNGTTDFTNPMGTGPFKLSGQQPGQSMSFVRNPNYWQSGLPYLDGVQLVNVPDETAQINALIAGQVDLIESVSAAGGKLAAANSNTKVININSVSWNAFAMDTARKPFTDARVRQAMRLLANRPAIRLAAQGGQGFLANDLFSIQDPDYNHGLPQRTFDPEHAKFLLKKAGLEKSKFTLHTGDVVGGIVDASVAFAAEAKKSGVNVAVQQHPANTYWTNTWLKQPFYVTSTGGRSLLATWLLDLAPNAPQPETHWRDARSAKLLKEALSTVDDKKRKPLVYEMQKIQYERGGYIIPMFLTFITPMRKNVHGIVKNVFQPVNNFSFLNVWLS